MSDLRIEDHAREGGQYRAGARIFAFVLLAACGAAAWYGLRAPRPAAVRVAVVTEAAGGGAGGAPPVLNASGYVTARRRATVSSKMTGKVTGVYVEEGMAVKAGQVLARLDDSIPRRYLELAEAELAATRRQEAEVAVRLKEARQNLDRARALVADGIAGQAELDKAEAEADAYQARLALIREQVTVQERQVGVRRTELDDAVIRAPFSGIAISKDAQPGEMVSPVSAGGGFTRTGISTIVDMSSLEIEVDVNESYINRVAPGQAVEAVLDAYPDWRIPSHVIAIVPTADRQKATVLVRIGFERLDARILPDMGVKVAFLGAAGAGAANPAPRIQMPRSAVRTDHGQSVTFVVAGDRVERRAVRIGEARGDLIGVVSGLAAGEQVVVEGPADLADGRRIRIR
ncbi:MAG TPA: efflux RND transporter periplasmic adaptor subunit [Vicinamibacterales bacterium]|nr:efflux RND transporter periplasmic adaptor subunit [Vicinamibacterales bacterium]HPW21478.1 efflux RND transporter periplasmic adaptor subunit [Vicinamibacterales bacterium]